MRIGIDGHMIGDHSGGNESYYTNILKNMIPEKNMELILFMNEGVDASEFQDVYKIVRFKSKSAFKRNFIELPRLCKKYKLDVLHTQYFIPFFNPCPVVCTIHDICFEHYKNIFTKKEYFRQKLLIPYAARKSKYIFTVSENAKQDIIEHYNVNHKKVIVTYNAVSESFGILPENKLNEKELREKFSIGNEKFILSVGNLQPRKNLPRLIRAFSKMSELYGNEYKLVIVGKKAWMYDDILKEALQKSDNIIFTDYVTNVDLVRLYNAADCFVYPSFFEGFGIPPLEAMACGKPVAVSNASSLPEVVGDAGIYFDPFDEIAIQKTIYKLLTDEECRKIIVENSKQQVKKFSWSDTAKKVVATYKKAIR